jgi:uncharacterized protein with ParB-like and HNH nuclease domain
MNKDFLPVVRETLEDVYKEYQQVEDDLKKANEKLDKAYKKWRFKSLETQSKLLYPYKVRCHELETAEWYLMEEIYRLCKILDIPDEVVYHQGLPKHIMPSLEVDDDGSK